jgi:hypothetical protein
MSITLPKLPHPVMNAMLGDDWADLFTADQLRARDLEIVRLMLEAAAQTCKQKAGRMRNMRDYAGGNALDHAAMLINERSAHTSTQKNERRSMKAAYADPPYLGCGVKHYGTRHDQAAEYDDPEAHRQLIERLCDEFDCWALSLHEPSLRQLLAMCPVDVRVGSWVKPFASFKANVTRAWTWEPVIFRFARDRTRDQPTWRDHVSAPIAMRKGFPGAKPEAFCFWVFEGLNLEPTDHFCDVFPGSGAVTEAWHKWSQRAQPVQTGLFAVA